MPTISIIFTDKNVKWKYVGEDTYETSRKNLLIKDYYSRRGGEYNGRN